MVQVFPSDGKCHFVLTDEITEAQNCHGQLWREDKLESLLRSCSGTTSEQVIECILEEVSAFANGQPQRDDMTLVVMTFKRGAIFEIASRKAAVRQTMRRSVG
jgi:serine phosphatase RsbU (regulator of sigma subunit)